MKTGLQGFLERSVVGVLRGTALLLAVLTSSLAGAVLAPAARADVSADGGLLCSGYAACSTGDFTDNGYPAEQTTSWWRMYPGDNCTNYVAYVESQIFGVAAPGYLLGDAYQWAANASANGVAVDDTPSVGAVAFWGPHTVGMKRYGHVAIVQAVGPDGSYIDISQSGMGKSDSGYDWERIYQGASSWEPWPDSFIHFPGTGVPQPGAQPAGAAQAEPAGAVEPAQAGEAEPAQAGQAGEAQPVPAVQAQPAGAAQAQPVPAGQAQPAPAPAPPASWPQVMLARLSWGPGAVGVSTNALQMPAA